MDNIFVGNRIKLAIKEGGFTQEEIATKIGVSKNTMSNYVTGKRSIEATLLAKIAHECRKPINYFIESEDAKIIDQENVYYEINKLRNENEKLKKKISDIKSIINSK